MLATIFVILIICATLIISLFSMRFSGTMEEFYVASRQIKTIILSPALSGAYMSAASFLGITGLVWLHGYDGYWYALGFFGGWVLLLLWFAGALRRFGVYTVPEFISLRWHSSRARMVAVAFTLVISLFYIVPQMVGAGELLGVLLGWDYTLSIVIIGVAVTSYVILGGMRAGIYNLAFLCIVLWVGMFTITVFTLAYFSWDYNALWGMAGEYIFPGRWLSPLNDLALAVGLVFGTAGLPHILTLYYTAPNAKTARFATIGVLVILAAFYSMTIITGLGARVLLGERGGVNISLPLLGELLGGPALEGLVIGGAFSAVLSTTAALLINSAGTFTQDIYVHIFKPGANTEEQLMVVKISTVVVGIFSILTGIMFKGYSIAFLVGLAFGIAASTFFPALFMGIWWRKTTEKGVIAGLIVGGLLSFLIIATNLLNLHPLENPAIISTPMAFLAIYLVSKWDAKIPSDIDELMYKMHSPTRDEK